MMTATSAIGSSSSSLAALPVLHSAAAAMAGPVLVDWSTRLAPATAVLLTLAPWPTIRELQSKGPVGSLPLLPYTCMSTQCFLWTTYGVLQDQAAIWLPNLLGTGLGLYFFLSFCQCAPRRAPTLPGSVRQHVAAVVGVTVATIVLTVALQRSATRAIGATAVAFAVALLASPLAALRTVLETRSAATIPLPFTVMSIVNCSLWLVVGCFRLRDANVIVPNFLGLMFGLLQVALQLKYGNNCQTVTDEDDPYCLLDYEKMPS